MHEISKKWIYPAFVIVVAVACFSSGFLIGEHSNRSEKGWGTSSNTEYSMGYSEESSTNEGPHYMCKKCSYGFNGLSSLVMQQGSRGNYYYYCPMCGELLTSNYGGNPLDNMFDSYSGVIDCFAEESE